VVKLIVDRWYWVVDDELKLLLYISSCADVWPFSCLSCGCYRRLSRKYGTIIFIFMSAIEDVMLPRLLNIKHIPYAEQVNKRASYNLHNLSSDNRLFSTKIDRWVYHCLPIYFYGATVWGPTLFIWWYVLTCWSSWIILYRDSPRDSPIIVLPRW